MAHVNGDGVRSVSPLRAFCRAAAALAAAAIALLAAPVHAGAQVAYVPVDGSPDSVLDPGSYGARASDSSTEDCPAFPSPVPEGTAAWKFVLPQADTLNPENVFDSVTLEFAAAGPVTITLVGPPSAYAIATTPTDDVLLDGSAEGSQSAGDGFPLFFELTATCFTEPPPPPPPPDTTTTTTTVAPVPPPTSPPGNPGPASTPSAPTAPPTKSQLLWSAAAVKLPFTGSLFALKPAVATTTTTAPGVDATPNTDANAAAASKSPGTSTPLDRGKLAGNTKLINGEAASVEISSSGPAPWGSLLLGAAGAGVVVFLIMAVTRRTDHRAGLRRPRLS